MNTVAIPRRRHKNGFEAVAEPFLQGDGLPFSDVLNAEWIQRVFREADGLFGQEDFFSTQIVLWAFLAQTLRDGKGAACAAAVADIATYLLQTGQGPPSGDTGDLSAESLRDCARERAIREVHQRGCRFGALRGHRPVVRAGGRVGTHGVV